MVHTKCGKLVKDVELQCGYCGNSFTGSSNGVLICSECASKHGVCEICGHHIITNVQVGDSFEVLSVECSVIDIFEVGQLEFVCYVIDGKPVTTTMGSFLQFVNGEL